jgi:hypothetical protein
VSKAENYRQQLKQLDDWVPFLLRQSGLPGRRANLELAAAVAAEGDKALFLRLSTYDAAQAPVNSPYEFLAFCGVLGLGQLLAVGDRSVLSQLRRYASDPRWRVREAVAMALQRWGQVDMAGLITEMAGWSRGSLLEQRAALAALCEPGLLQEAPHIERVLELLDQVIGTLAGSKGRPKEEVEILRKGLGYCWSVAVAAWPEKGKAVMENWFDSTDRDIRWVMQQNLKKKRLERMDAAWVARARAKLAR